MAVCVGSPVDIRHGINLHRLLSPPSLGFFSNFRIPIADLFHLPAFSLIYLRGFILQLEAANQSITIHTQIASLCTHHLQLTNNLSYEFINCSLHGSPEMDALNQ